MPTTWLANVRLVGEMLTAGAVPVPLRLTLWGLPVALSARVMAAVRVPLAVGVKVTLIVQLTPAATLEPQLLVCAKSLALAPETAMLVTLKDVLPEFVRVIVWAVLVVPTDWLPKSRLVDDRLTTAAALVPVPERVTAWGLPLTLSVMDSEAVRLPLAAGLNVTLTEQLALAASELPQVLVWVKSLALAPVSAMLVMLIAALPVLFRVMD